MVTMPLGKMDDGTDVQVIPAAVLCNSHRVSRYLDSFSHIQNIQTLVGGELANLT